MFRLNVYKIIATAILLANTIVADNAAPLKPCSATIAPHDKFSNSLVQVSNTSSIYSNAEGFSATKLAKNSVNLQAGKSAHGKSIMRLQITGGDAKREYRYFMQDGQACNARFLELADETGMEVFVEDSIKYA